MARELGKFRFGGGQGIARAVVAPVPPHPHPYRPPRHPRPRCARLPAGGGPRCRHARPGFPTAPQTRAYPRSVGNAALSEDDWSEF
jgi:methyl-accepting chemotaxis protein